MLVITRTRHSGTLFLSSTLQTAGLTVQSRKRVLAGGRVPPGSMVALPIPKLAELGDRADRVIALVRPWRAWASVMEEEEPNPKLPHEVRWWFSNYELICTLMRGRARFLMLSHDKLLSRPEPTVQRVLRFLDREDAKDQVLLLPAIAPSAPAFASKVFGRDEQEVLSDFWKVVHNEQAMTRRTFQRMNVLQDTLRRRYPKVRTLEPMRAQELQSKVPA